MLTTLIILAESSHVSEEKDCSDGWNMHRRHCLTPHPRQLSRNHALVAWPKRA